jgi:hypothetical protein
VDYVANSRAELPFDLDQSGRAGRGAYAAAKSTSSASDAMKKAVKVALGAVVPLWIAFAVWWWLTH